MVIVGEFNVLFSNFSQANLSRETVMAISVTVMEKLWKNHGKSFFAKSVGTLPARVCSGQARPLLPVLTVLEIWKLGRHRGEGLANWPWEDDRPRAILARSPGGGRPQRARLVAICMGKIIHALSLVLIAAIWEMLMASGFVTTRNEAY